MDVARIAEQLRAVADQVSGSVTPAAADGLSALTGEVGSVPDEVTEFFTEVGEVKLANLWNGYFVGPPSWSASLYQAGEPRAFRKDGQETEIVVVASNGGGVLYAVPVSGGEVYVLPPSGIDNGVYDADSFMARTFRPVAGSFGEFLDRLAGAALAGEPDPFDPYR